jgi:hypothetical protein
LKERNGASDVKVGELLVAKDADTNDLLSLLEQLKSLLHVLGPSLSELGVGLISDLEELLDLLSSLGFMTSWSLGRLDLLWVEDEDPSLDIVDRGVL